MASLLAAENWSCMDVDVMDTNNHLLGATGRPVSSFSSNNAVLMSLLEETQGDQEHDEERLSSLIRALEVELIDPTTSEGHNENFMDNTHLFGSINQESFQPFDAGSVNGGDCLEIDSSGGFGWIDMEIGSSSQYTDESSVDWYMGSCLDEIESSSNFGGSQEYNIYKGISTSTTSINPFDHQNLWQETYMNTRMHV